LEARLKGMAMEATWEVTGTPTEEHHVMATEVGMGAGTGTGTKLGPGK
jgi:hypothetical protein